MTPTPERDPIMTARKKLSAAEELIRAQDAARLLSRVGRLTTEDAQRVGRADQEYTQAKKS